MLGVRRCQVSGLSDVLVTEAWTRRDQAGAVLCVCVCVGVRCGGNVERIIRYSSVAQDLDGRYRQELLAGCLVEVPGGCALTCRLFRINQRGTGSPMEL